MKVKRELPSGAGAWTRSHIPARPEKNGEVVYTEEKAVQGTGDQGNRREIGDSCLGHLAKEMWKEGMTTLRSGLGEKHPPPPRAAIVSVLEYLVQGGWQCLDRFGGMALQEEHFGVSKAIPCAFNLLPT